MPGYARANKAREHNRSSGTHTFTQNSAARTPPHYGIDAADRAQTEPSASIMPITPVAGERSSQVTAPIVQNKLTIGEPDDKYEQEADQVAERVMRMPHSAVQKTTLKQAEEKEKVQTKPEKVPVTNKTPEPAQIDISSGAVAGSEEKDKKVQAKALQTPQNDEQKKREHQEPAAGAVVQRQPGDFSRGLRVSRKVQGVNATNAGRSADMEQAASFAIRNKGAGAPLAPSIRSRLEAGTGSDLGDVRVHSNPAAHSAASTLGARAFTHGNDIWLGRGESSTDLRLMAHESTHVVQQTGGVQRQAQTQTHTSDASVSNAGGQDLGGTVEPVPAISAKHLSAVPETQQPVADNPEQPDISSATSRIQRLGNPFTAIGSALSSAAEWVGDSLSSAVDFIKEKASEYVSEMPGYSLFTVMYGSDPISGRSVDRNGRNFINAGLDVIPNGAALKQKLEEEGALDEAAQWLDTQIAILDFNPREIASQFSSFWDSLSISDATRIPTVLERLARIIREPLGRIIQFAENIASELLRIIKDYVVSSLIQFIREQTNAYPLMTVILGRDPVSGEVVERTPIALLEGFMQLSESGQEQLRQMRESGSLQRAANWLDGAVARLNITWETISGAFSAAWDLVGIENLLSPIATFRDLYNIFAGPVGRIFNFIVEVGTKVLSYIKDALLSRLTAFARTVRGYPLISVILGKDPISQAPVERNTANIIHGFMSLMENGEQQYQEMVESGAIARMSARIEAAMAMLNFTWEYVRGLFTTAWDSFSLQDLALPLEAFRRLMDIFTAPVTRLVNFIGEIIKVVIEVLMEVMNFPIDLIRNIITRAMQAIEDIKRDPMGFLKNLLRAVKTGFQQFFDNILTHLLNGVTSWLFSELQDANISPPADLSFQSILGFVLDVLGITVERIWQKLAERIGEERVARIRGMIDRLTGIWTFVKDVATRGPVAIWEYIQERLSNLWNTVLESVRNWVVTRIVERVVARLLSMLDPTGIMAVINGFIAFYNAVQSFIRYLREMLEIVNSFVVGVAELARGNVSIAANFLESSLAQAMPVAIGFLANQVGLSGIGRRIGEMIERVRGMVDQALTWLVDRAVSAGSSLLNMGRNAVASVTNWWQSRKRFRNSEGETHTLYFEGQGPTARLMMRSRPQYYAAYLSSLEVPTDKEAAKAAATAKAEEIDELLRQSTQDNPPDSSIISAKLDELADLTVDLDVPAAGTFNPSYGRTTAENFATSVRVSTLSNNDEGSTVNQSYVNRNDTFRTLKARRQGGTSYYIAGHMLNNNLGGPGNDWRNLTPLTQYANTQDHEPNFERDAKKAVIDDGKTIDFVVNARYGSHPNLKTNKVADLRASGDTVLADVIEAESKVPTALDCSAVEVGGSLIKRHTVRNTIDTNLDNYDLVGIPAEKVHLLEMNEAELVSLNGIDADMAGQILALDKNSIRRWSTLEREVPGINTHAIRTTPGKRVLLYKVSP